MHSFTLVIRGYMFQKLVFPYVHGIKQFNMKTRLKDRYIGRYGPVMTDSSRLQQHYTTSDDPGQGCKAHEGGIRP